MTDNQENRSDYTLRFCMMCRRAESDNVKLITIPGGMNVCTDCLQNSFNMMNDPQVQQMFGLNNIFQGMPGTNNNGSDTVDHGMSGQKSGGTVQTVDFREVPDTSSQQSEEKKNPDGRTDGTAGRTVDENGRNAAGRTTDKNVRNAAGRTAGENGENSADGHTDGNTDRDTAGNTEISRQQSEPESKESDTEKDGLFGIPGLGKIPGISVINLGSLGSLGNLGSFQKAQAGNQSAKKEKKEPKIKDIRSIPAPHKIHEALSEYVIGQEQAKKVISVAVYNHYKRIFTNTMDEIEIDKSNILLLGPTGCGKTYLVRTLARILDVPLAIADATSLTEAGYIGDDIESVISKLLAAADNDVERCEQGIVFIDEIDKIAKKKNQNQRDVSGESVQQGLLSLLEGSRVEVPVGASSKNAMVPMVTVNTRNILFICGGAFPGLDEIIKTRLNQHAAIGYGADLKDRWEDDPDILTKVTSEDIRSFGMIPEFIGRLPVICALHSMTKEMLIQIMKEPKNAILRQYQKLLELDEVKLNFDDSALEAIAEKALEKKTGARALRAVIEEFMLDIMYEIPKDDNIGEVTITGDYIRHTGGPLISIRGQGRKEITQNS